MSEQSQSQLEIPGPRSPTGAVIQLPTYRLCAIIHEASESPRNRRFSEPPPAYPSPLESLVQSMRREPYKLRRRTDAPPPLYLPHKPTPKNKQTLPPTQKDPFPRTRRVLHERYLRRFPFTHPPPSTTTFSQFHTLIKQKVDSDISFAVCLFQNFLPPSTDQFGGREIKDHDLLRMYDAAHAAHEEGCMGTRRYDGKCRVGMARGLDGEGEDVRDEGRYKFEKYFAEGCDCRVKERLGEGRVSFGEGWVLDGDEETKQWWRRLLCGFC